MKVLRQFVLAAVLVVITLSSWMAYYLGAFKSVEIAKANRPAMKMIFKEHIGSYHKVVSVIQEVESWAKLHNIDCTQSFGEYIDDANMVEEIRLRSRGGCIVSEIPKELPEGFKSQEIPARSYVTAIFEGSPGIGPVKVYPKAAEFMREQGLVMDGPVIEIYIIHSEKEMTTTYLFPLASAPRF